MEPPPPPPGDAVQVRAAGPEGGRRGREEECDPLWGGDLAAGF